MNEIFKIQIIFSWKNVSTSKKNRSFREIKKIKLFKLLFEEKIVCFTAKTNVPKDFMNKPFFHTFLEKKL